MIPDRAAVQARWRVRSACMMEAQKKRRRSAGQHGSHGLLIVGPNPITGIAATGARVLQRSICHQGPALTVRVCCRVSNSRMSAPPSPQAAARS